MIRHGDQAGLEELVLAKVRNARRRRLPPQVPQTARNLITCGKDLAGDAEPVTWVNQGGARRPQLSNLLEKFMEKDFSHSMIQVDGESRYRLNQKS